MSRSASRDGHGPNVSGRLAEPNPTAESIRSHYRRMAERLGYDVQPPFGLVSGWGDSLLRKEKFDPDEHAERGWGFELLDQLALEHLYGVR